MATPTTNQLNPDNVGIIIGSRVPAVQAPTAHVTRLAGNNYKITFECVFAADLTNDTGAPVEIPNNALYVLFDPNANNGDIYNSNHVMHFTDLGDGMYLNLAIKTGGIKGKSGN